jgi:hypothetical protein
MALYLCRDAPTCFLAQRSLCGHLIQRKCFDPAGLFSPRAWRLPRHLHNSAPPSFCCPRSEGSRTMTWTTAVESSLPLKEVRRQEVLASLHSSEHHMSLESAKPKDSKPVDLALIVVNHVIRRVICAHKPRKSAPAWSGLRKLKLHEAKISGQGQPSRRHHFELPLRCSANIDRISY